MSATSTTGFFLKAASKWTGQVGAGGVPDASTTTIPLASSTGLDDGYVYVFSIDRVDANNVKTPAKWEVCIGKVSGSNLINCIRGVEGTAQAHATGAVVEVLMTASHWNKLVDGLVNLGIDPNTAKFNSILVKGLSSPPSSPSSGDLKFFVDSDGIAKLVNPAGSVSRISPPKATATEINTGTDDEKYTTSKAIGDSNIVFTTKTQTLTNKTLTSPVIDTSFSGTAKASASDINTGTDDTKIVTPKAIKDSTLAYRTGVAFYAYQSTAQNIPNMDFTKINYNTEVFDLGSNFDPSQSRFTAPVAGYYLFTGCICFSANANGDRNISLYVNGSVRISLDGKRAVATAGWGTQVVASAFLSLSANDYVEIFGLQSSGGTLPTHIWYQSNFFSGCRLPF